MLQQPPQNITADTIESLFEIYKVDAQGGLPLDTLFYNNPQCWYLLFLSQLFIQCNLDARQDHSAKHDATPVFTVAQITFLGQLD